MVTVRKTGTGEDGTLCAYFTSSHDLTAAELREHLSGLLPGYMVPQHFIQVPEIPSRQTERSIIVPCRAGFHSRPRTRRCRYSEWSGGGTARGDLGRGPPGEHHRAHDTFVSLGGTSLALIDMRIRLTSEFGVELPLQTLFAHPTVAQLAVAVSEAQAAAPEAAG